MITKKEIKQLNKSHGKSFFSRENMSFFNSKIETSGFTCGESFLFITSEKFSDQHPRLYTLRAINAFTGAVETVGPFQAYKSLKNAREILFEKVLKGAY